MTGKPEACSRVWITARGTVRGVPSRMKDICSYADRPFAFVARYVKVRPVAHAAIVTAVARVACPWDFGNNAIAGVCVFRSTVAGGRPLPELDARNRD